MSKPPVQNTSAFRTSNRYGAVAIVCLCTAMLNFGVGVFINRPESVSGIIFMILGILFALSGSVFFALFNHFSKSGQKSH
ncbi:MAG: hypothetical protein NVS4B11_05430 [Ktedonobacteraceae bacterium]